MQCRPFLLPVVYRTSNHPLAVILCSGHRAISPAVSGWAILGSMVISIENMSLWNPFGGSKGLFGGRSMEFIRASSPSLFTLYVADGRKLSLKQLEPVCPIKG